MSFFHYAIWNQELAFQNLGEKIPNFYNWKKNMNLKGKLVRVTRDFLMRSSVMTAGVINTRLEELSTWQMQAGNGNHSSILVWRIPLTEEPGGLQSMGS